MNTVPYIFVFVAFLVSPPSAHAVLGGPEANLAAESQTLNAKHASFALSSFTKHEMTRSKVTIQQFAGNGKVFAVAWHGKTHPEFSQLLGTHYDDFETALEKAKSHHHGHGPLVFDADNVHFEMGGVGRSVYGRVWLKDQIPQNVSADDLR